KNYISRLKEIDTKINQLLDDLNYRESIGIIPPLFSLEKCEKQISDFLSENPKENVLVVSLDKKISDIKTITNKEKYIEELSKDANKLTEEVREDSVNSFEKFPKGELLWKTVSQMEYSSAPAAIYHHVNKSGSKPGVVIFNPILINRKNIFTYAAHEGIIGHHMGEGIKVQSQSLPFIRTILPFTTWSEGWAMYAEELALENYEKKTAYDEFAILQREMWAAVRMVVDVGIHYKRWTREQAIDYMKEKTGLSDKMVETEIERDCVDPGQALAYELSKLKFIEMRKYAENNLKNSFNEKDYHTFILENGAMPLDIFEKSIKNWVAQKKVNTNFILIFSPTDLLGTRLVIVYRSGFYI
nr:DUF885 domain-containing protein [Fusobacteriaceae bacterium]